MLEKNFFLFWGRKYLFIYLFPLIPVVNAQTRILVLEEQLEYGFMSLKDNWQMSISTPEVVHELRLKRGKPIGSKDVTPQKRRTQMSIGTPEVVHELCLKRGKLIGSNDVPPQKRRTQMSIGTTEEVHDKKKNNNNS